MVRKNAWVRLNREALACKPEEYWEHQGNHGQPRSEEQRLIVNGLGSSKVNDDRTAPVKEIGVAMAAVAREYPQSRGSKSRLERRTRA